MATPTDIYAALKEVFDPEIGLSVVDLGLIYGVQVSDEGRVDVEMTLTTPGCPMHRVIGRTVEAAVRALPDIKEVRVRFVWEPRWTPDLLSAEGKKHLGLA